MNTKDYCIPKYGIDIEVKRELLSDNNVSSVENFCGTEDDIDFVQYLKEDAINDNMSRAYIYKNVHTGEAIAFVSISCSAIMIEEGSSTIDLAPAVQIDRFIVDKRYRRKQYSLDDSTHSFSSMVFMNVLEFIENIVENTIGAKYVVLYSVPEAYHFYKDKCDMCDFDEYMRRVDDYKVDACYPMYCFI